MTMIFRAGLQRSESICKCLFAVCLILLSGGLLQDVWAQTPPNNQACVWNLYPPGRNMGYFVARCVEQRAIGLGSGMILELQTLLAPILFPVCTIAIVLLAIKVTLGGAGRNALGQTLALMFKICIVYYMAVDNGATTLAVHMQEFLSGSAEIASLIFNGATAYLSTIRPSFSLCGGTNVTSGVPGGGLPELFYQFDCYGTTLLGMQGTGGGAFTAAKLAVLIAGLFFVGPFGAAVLVAAISMILLYLAATFKVLLYVTTIYISLAILFGIGPIIIPLWLFGPTRQIAVIWFNNVIVYLLLPAILTAYLMMMQLIFLGASGGLYHGPRVYENLNLGTTDVLAEFINIPSTVYDEKNGTAAVAGQLFDKAGNYMNEMISSDPMTLFKKATRCGFKCQMSNLSTAVDSATGAIVDLTAGVEQDWKRFKEAAMKRAYQAVVKGHFFVKHIRISPEKIMNFMAIAVANIILLSMMLSYLDRLMEDANRMISKSGIVDPNMVGVASVEKLTSSTIHGIASNSKYGRYL